jgi:hypothetical protein
MAPTKRSLKALKANSEDFLRRHKARGGKTVTYQCVTCKLSIETRVPTEEQANSRGCWDGLQTCHHCGRNNFITVWPNGNLHVLPPEKPTNLFN